MAEKSPAPSAPKKISCRVVSNYGRHIPGEVITVEEKEYFRFRVAVLDEDEKPTGEHRFPVLIAEADAAALAKREESERAAKMRAAQSENDHGSGWADMEQQSLAIVRARYAESQALADEERRRILAEHAA